jgi:hypothetical protein
MRPVADFLRHLLDAVQASTMSEVFSFGDTLNELIVLLRGTGHYLCAMVRNTSFMRDGWK